MSGNPYIVGHGAPRRLDDDRLVTLTDEAPPVRHVLDFASRREAERFHWQLYDGTDKETGQLIPRTGRGFLVCRDCRKEYQVGTPDPRDRGKMMFRERVDRRAGDTRLVGHLRCDASYIADRERRILTP